MDLGSSSIISGLRSLEKMLQVAANNIANVNTPGYKEQRVVLTESSYGGVTATVTRNLTPGRPIQNQEAQANSEPQEQSNVNLGEQMVQLMLTRRIFEADINALKIIEETRGAILDILG